MSSCVDVVLLDLEMPMLDGYETLARMKSDERLRHLPVIVVSSIEDLDSVVRCIKIGATDYLPRPFNAEVLRARLNASLAEKRLHDLQLEYLEQVGRVADAAAAIEAETFVPETLDGVAARDDALGQLARVFQRMAREVVDRERRLKAQVQQLRIEIDEACAARKVDEITDTDFFRNLQEKASTLRLGSEQADGIATMVARLIAVHSFRGGTGKSNTTANVATMLAAEGRRVGVVDLDIQSPGIHVIFGFDQDQAMAHSLNDYLWGDCELRGRGPRRHPDRQTASSPGGVWLVPSSMRPGDIARVMQQGYDVNRLNGGFRKLASELSLDVAHARHPSRDQRGDPALDRDVERARDRPSSRPAGLRGHPGHRRRGPQARACRR